MSGLMEGCRCGKCADCVLEARRTLLREVEIFFANGDEDDGMDLWRRISEHLTQTAPASGA